MGWLVHEWVDGWVSGWFDWFLKRLLRNRANNAHQGVSFIKTCMYVVCFL